MRYFVTGATGFLGGKLVRELLGAGHDVVALVRSTTRAQELAEDASRLKGRLDFSEGDVTDRDSMRPGMSGADGVFHAAAIYKVGLKGGEAKRAVEINVDGTRKVCELMRELEVPRGVYTSTLAVNGDTDGRMVDEDYRYDGPQLSVYDRTKWQAHWEVARPMMDEGLPLTIAMPGVIYGPGDHSSIGRNIRKYLRGKLPMLPARPEYCWAYVDDVAHAHVLCMEKGEPGQSYIVAGERRSLVDAFKLMEELCGVPAPKRTVGPGMMRFLSAFMQAFLWLNPPQDYHPETLRVAAKATYLGDNTKARRELGYDPRPLREGLVPTLKGEMEKLGMSWPGESESG